MREITSVRTFLELDVDENERISTAEAAAVPQLAANFETFDKDDNGGLDPQEYMAAQDTGLIPDNHDRGPNGG